MIVRTETTASPHVVGRYALYDRIASGGMASVHLARLMSVGGFARTVAIKRLHPQYASDPEFVTLFLDEARLAARIRHPNVVPTLDIVATEGELFLVMEWIQGESLWRVPKDGGTALKLADGQTNPESLAVDSTHVYWANRDAAGAILRVAK